MAETLDGIVIGGTEYDIGGGGGMVKDDDSQANLNIGDENGNVIVQFKDGHIKTKNFDSRNASAKSSTPYGRKYMHFSLDDFSSAIGQLAGGSYSSIFQQTTFKKLKEWHDKYGIVVSLYLQQDMASVPTKYAQEFIDNKHWLKFAWHGTNATTGSASYDGAKTIWNNFVNGIMTSIGDYEVIDRVPRLDYFHCTEEGCKGIRDASCGAWGFLGCDDWSYNKATRGTNYYLTEEQCVYLDNHNRWFDPNTQLTFIKTDLRLEQVVQRWTTVDALKAFYESAEGANQSQEMIVFSHENYMSNSQYLSFAESIFAWGVSKGYNFEFPMNTIRK